MSRFDSEFNKFLNLFNLINLLDGQTPMEIINGKINLTTPCNSDCHCSGFSYTPVCWEETGDTFFNPCVASCNAYSKENKVKAFIKLFSSHF